MARAKASRPLSYNPIPVDENGFRLNYIDIWGMDTRFELDQSKLITSGAWVLITKSPPVDNGPQAYGIYWAMPVHRKGRTGVKDKTGAYTHEEIKDLTGVDKYGRQCAAIYMPHEVRIFPDEYTILTEERVNTYRDLGWAMHQTGAVVQEPLNLEMLQQGRDLVEEEREIIWALQLDGLTEQQACEEYFLTHHTETENVGICYLPDQRAMRQLIAVFGPR